MNPKKGQKVAIYFKNGSTAQGIVLSWSDQKSVLRSLHNRNLLIIHNTLDNIQMVYVELDRPEQQPSSFSPTSPQPFKPQPPQLISTQQKKQPKPIVDINSSPTDFTLRSKKIAELRLLKIEEEKKSAIEAASSFELKNQPLVEYAPSSILFKQHSRKKVI